MKALVMFVLLLLLGWGVGLGVVVVQAPGTVQRDARFQQWRHEIGSVPDPEAQVALAEGSARFTREMGRVTRAIPTNRDPGWSAILPVTYVRLRLAGRCAPLAGGLVVVGLLAGLLGRARKAEEVGFHSVTVSHGGKLMVIAATGGFVLAATLPLLLPLWSLYLFPAALALGTRLYFANLPPRI